jgi:hypothetical protein
MIITCFFGGGISHFSAIRRKVFPAISLITYLLVPRGRVLLEKLTGSQLVKKFPAFYGTRRLIISFPIPNTFSYPEPDLSSSCPHIPLPEDTS